MNLKKSLEELYSESSMKIASCSFSLLKAKIEIEKYNDLSEDENFKIKEVIDILNKHSDLLDFKIYKIYEEDKKV